MYVKADDGQEVVKGSDDKKREVSSFSLVNILVATAVQKPRAYLFVNHRFQMMFLFEITNESLKSESALFHRIRNARTVASKNITTGKDIAPRKIIRNPSIERTYDR